MEISQANQLNNVQFINIVEQQATQNQPKPQAPKAPKK
jgi:hypothetical protein